MTQSGRITTNWYACSKCHKPCGVVPVAVFGSGAVFDPASSTQEPVSDCCGQLVVVRSSSSKDW
jgi:hypothetical protein